MSKNLVINGLIKDIRDKKEEARTFNETGRTRECNEAKQEIRRMNSNLMTMLEIADGKNDAESFVDILKGYSGILKTSDTDATIINFMRETSAADGGLLVPNDVQTAVKVLRSDSTNLEELVNIEPVKGKEGRRTYEIKADDSVLIAVEEGKDIPEVDHKQLKDVKYEIKKWSGIITVTSELIKDTKSAVLTWIKSYLAKKSRATRNHAIINLIGEITTGKEVVVTDIQGLKDIFNSDLEDYCGNITVLTNTSGYKYLDNLKDDAGNKLLESDIVNRGKLLFGLYPVMKVPNKILPNNESNAPIICGDFKEAITLFDREAISIDISTRGLTFFSEKVKIKVRDRFDIQAVDTDAIIKAEVEIIA